MSNLGQQEPPPASPFPLGAAARRLRRQAVACAQLGSPLYAGLLDHAADDLLAGGPTADVLDGHLDSPWRSALALRMLGGVHALVLTGQAPELAAFYPSAGGTADPGPGYARAWAALRQALAGQRDAVRAWLDRPPQTNEVGRAAALLGGLRYLTAEVGLPVRLVEIVLAGAWRGQPPPASPSPITAAPVEVIERTGGDRTPIDPMTDQGRLTLAAYVWPDQAHRMERLRGALTLAAHYPVDLRQELASDTLRRTALAEGTWTVLWHSIVRQYLDEAQRSAVTEGIAALGAAATSSARFAWIALEPHRITPDGACLVTMTTWPGGHERVLGSAPPHGLPVTWNPQEPGEPAGLPTLP